jgi:hypothetical protein
MQNSKIEPLIYRQVSLLDQRSIYYRNFTYLSWKVRTLPSFDFPVSETLIPHHVYSSMMDDPPAFGTLQAHFILYLKIMLRLLEETMVGPRAPIQRLIFVLFFCTFLLSIFRSHGHREFGMGDPKIIFSPPPELILLILPCDHRCTSGLATFSCSSLLS